MRALSQHSLAFLTAVAAAILVGSAVVVFAGIVPNTPCYPTYTVVRGQGGGVVPDHGCGGDGGGGGGCQACVNGPGYDQVCTSVNILVQSGTNNCYTYPCVNPWWESALCCSSDGDPCTYSGS